MSDSVSGTRDLGENIGEESSREKQVIFTGDDRPTAGGLRKRTSKMVPKIAISSEFQTSNKRENSFQNRFPDGSKRTSNGSIDLSENNPPVNFKDPLSHNFDDGDSLSVDLISPMDNISLSSDGTSYDDRQTLNSFNSKNLYRETNFGGDDDDVSEEDMLLPNAEVRNALKEGKNVETKIVEQRGFIIALQVFFPFMVAGLGTVAAGLLLDVVQHWEVFKEVSEVFILVPALLGLKGNLEMTLASRLSTAANTGAMDNAREQASLIVGNIVLTQAQALIVAALASMAAVVFGWVLDGHFDVHHAWLLGASSLVTASLASLILGSIMVGVIILSKKCGVNPDNVATPIAASLGDLTTLALLSTISAFLYNRIGTHYWIAPLICFSCVILLPLWLYISHHNKYTHDTLYTGWMPVIMAMCISSGGGLVLSYIVERYHGIAVFNPVINGVGGNLVAVQASRISTSLHRVSVLGILPAGVRYGCISSFCTAGGHAKTARILIAMSIPGHLIFLAIIAWMKAGHTSLTIVFTAAYLLAGVLQVTILLFTANWMVHWMWKRKNDPDNFSIPYLTAIGDLLGTVLLAITFHVLWLIGDRDADVGD